MNASKRMRPCVPRVVLLDVDGTLLDNDHFNADLTDFLERTVGFEYCSRYWEIYEELRESQDYADYLGAIQRLGRERPRIPQLLQVSSFLVNSPFRNRLFPGALAVVERIKQHSRPVILSDGDIVFQPLKVERSGLSEAVDGHVMISLHKEQEPGETEFRYPADHYIFVDDKLRILEAVKETWGERVTTIQPLQGHYAKDPDTRKAYGDPDATIRGIEQLEQGLIDLVSRA